ncbi:RHS repeat-associated core domain-containing protein [Pseudomonas sp. B8(2017)]|uniref:RHS repeat-associated core domain-containing protein n=1 Tax=Pseudomonas sp. B8(2017) TaxID=1981711 RepID=UPI000A1E39DC|nr:RHS repeat-associated core domain-containing protein [Pseudomonas sp. B8(2017)]
MKTNSSSDLLFYQTGKISNIKSKNQWRRIFRTHELLLAENINESSKEIKLLASNENGTVLEELDEQSSNSLTYSAYGHYFNQEDSSFLLRLNAELFNSILLGYALGNGNRIFSPLRMRFNSPDDYSPFEEGGLNSYAYCFCDPVNFIDPSGNNPIRSFFKGIANTLGFRTKGATKTQTRPSDRRRSLQSAENRATENEIGVSTVSLPGYSMLPHGKTETVEFSGFTPDIETITRLVKLEKRAESLVALGNRERLVHGELIRRLDGKKIKSKHRGNADYYYGKAKKILEEADFIRDNMKTRKNFPPKYSEQ